MGIQPSIRHLNPRREAHELFQRQYVLDPFRPCSICIVYQDVVELMDLVGPPVITDLLDDLLI